MILTVNYCRNLLADLVSHNPEVYAQIPEQDSRTADLNFRDSNSDPSYRDTHLNLNLEPTYDDDLDSFSRTSFSQSISYSALS